MALAFAAALTGAELYGRAGPSRQIVNTPELRVRDDDELGYRNPIGMRIVSKEYSGKTELYDVVYSFDPMGWRLTPPAPAAAPAVLFFGDSVEFGMGVNDAETIPAVFQSESRGRYRAVNLAVSGWGPHQMLRTLQLGLERSAAAPNRPAAAFYLALPSHVLYAAGAILWDQHGPRYDIDGSGTLRYEGPFHGRLWARCARILSYSSVLGSLWYDRHRREPGGVRERRDDERLVSIVAESRRLFKERYGGELYVVLDSTDDFPEQLLCSNGTVCIRAKSLGVPGHEEPGYFISDVDHHPNARWQRALGTALASWALARDAHPR